MSPSLKPNDRTDAEDSDFFKQFWEGSWTYTNTVVDVVREPVLILNKDLCVTAASDSFYRAFKVSQKETEHKRIYELGNGQWDIPFLRQLLEDIIPNKTHFKGYEVTRSFPHIGRKVIMLNGRQIHNHTSGVGTFPPSIMLAMEDVTEMFDVAGMLARHTNQFEAMITERSKKLEADMGMMKQKIKILSQQ